MDQCTRCFVIYHPEAHRKRDYEKGYFFEEYQRQYGQTYAEDRMGIIGLHKKRLKFLWKCFPHLRNKPLNLLEIGSAYGYLHDALEDIEVGHTAYRFFGVEASSHAVEVLQEKPINVLQGEAPHVLTALKAHSFDIVFAFYTIEHIERESQRMLWQEIKRLLNPGGIFYVAVPSVFGPLFLFDFVRWYDSHPQDHFVDYSPVSIRRIAQIHGFDLREFRIPSFHPERFPFGLMLKPVYRWLCQSLAFGDTLEAILVKR